MFASQGVLTYFPLEGQNWNLGQRWGQLCVLHCLDANGAKMPTLSLIDWLRHAHIMNNYK